MLEVCYYGKTYSEDDEGLFILDNYRLSVIGLELALSNEDIDDDVDLQNETCYRSAHAWAKKMLTDHDIHIDRVYDCFGKSLHFALAVPKGTVFDLKKHRNNGWWN